MAHDRKPLKTSLTVLDGPEAKAAVGAFKALLSYTGDRPNPNPQGMALQFLNFGYGKPDMQSELYMQILKQLTDPPAEFSKTKGWEMLVLCLWNFAPPTGLDDFVSVFCAENHPEGHRLVSLMHKTQHDGARYSEAAMMPSYEQLPAILSAFFAESETQSRSRWSVDESAKPVLPDDRIMNRMRQSMVRMGHPDPALQAKDRPCRELANLD